MAAHMPGTFLHDTDKAIVRIPELEPHPAVNYLLSRKGVADSLAFPATVIDPDHDNPYRFGPNFMFVPEPATAVLVGLGAYALVRRRSERALDGKA